MDKLTAWISIASTFSVLVPLYFLLLDFRSHDLKIKALALFLAIGFLADMSTWYFFSTQNFAAQHFVHNAYDLFEAAFLLWFLGKVSPNVRVKFLLTNAWVVLIPFWCTRFYSESWIGWFKTFTQLALAFTSCFIILKMVEKNENVSRNLMVWILIGIFFYCFCTYFILGTLVFVFENTWFSHNLVNITTNLIYCIGFIRSKSELAEKM
jgi:hypothetical protein